MGLEDKQLGSASQQINILLIKSLMESELNRTPVKAEFDYDSESPVGNFSDLLEKSDSPSYVKWDFILPAFSDKIKNAAMKLKSDVRKERLQQIRSSRRRYQDNSKSTPTKIKNGRLFSRKFYTPVKQLQHIHDEVESSCHNEKIGSTSRSSEASSSHLVVDDKCDKTELMKYKTDLLSSDSNDDLFNDSVNDLFSECSQTVEDKFYKQPKKKLFSKEPEENLLGGVDELINEKDDDLFLEVDLNNLDNNL